MQSNNRRSSQFVMADLRKRARGNNFQYEDNLRLVELISTYKHVLQNKRSDAVTWRQKDDTWVKLCHDFNSGSATPRTVEQLKSKYENLKKKARQNVAEEKKNTFKTGGGSYKSVIDDPLTDKLLSLISVSALGTQNEWDSNAVESVELGLDNGPAMKDGVVTDSIHDEPLTEEVVSTVPALVSENWHGSGYCPTMMKQPKYPVLDVLLEGATEWQGVVPITTVSAMIVPSTRPAAEQLVPPVPEDTCEETVLGSMDTTRSGDQSPVLPRTVRKPWSRRRPQLPPTQTVISNNSLRFGTLAVAKTELVKLQMEIVKQEYEERKERDVKEHLLRVELLELDIELKKEELRKSRMQDT